MKYCLYFLAIILVTGCGTASVSPIDNDHSELFYINESIENTEVVTMNSNSQEISKISFAHGKSYYRIILLNTTYLTYFERLNSTSKVVGIVDKDLVFKGGAALSSSLNRIEEVGANGVLNTEAIIALNPDIIICNSFQSEGVLNSVNCPVLVVNEFWENTPLGKSEWIKVFGVLTRTSASANQIFDNIVERYEGAKQRLQKERIEVKVMSLNRFSDSFFTPGCESLISNLIGDAGLTSMCFAKTTKSVEISEEQVLVSMEKSNYLMFFDGGTPMVTRNEILNYFSVSEDYKGQILYCNTAKNNYFESSILEPYKVLQDLISITNGRENKNKYFTLL